MGSCDGMPATLHGINYSFSEFSQSCYFIGVNLFIAKYILEYYMHGDMHVPFTKANNKKMFQEHLFLASLSLS